jgi:tetratricopeptide (TPR) repeat protein
LALLYLEAKAPALALPHLRKATSIAPKDPAARFELARTLIALKRPQEAIEPLREVVRLAPKERGARALLAQIYASQKRPTDAYSQWAAAAQNDARDLEAHLQAAGLAADALKRPNDAEKWLRRAEKGVPRDPRPPLLLGRLLLARGDAKGAARALSNANRLAPDALEIYPILADARIAARDLRGARGAIQSALTRLPRGQNAAQKAQIRGIEGGFRLTLGRILGQMKKPREAKIEFARAVEALPRDPNALSLLATASAQMGDLTGATKALQKALEIDAKRAGDRRFLAQVLAQSKNYSAASEQFALYTRLQPRDMGALAQWVEVAAQKRDRALELEILGKLVALDSKNPAPHLQRGVILRDLKRPREALNSFNRALKMRPQDPNVLFEVARLETQLKQPKSAALTWQKIIVVRPDFLPAYPALLQNSSQSGQTPSARLFLARRLATNENPRALSEILRFYEKNRRNSEAEALLIDIVRRNPRTRAAKAALDSFKVVTPKATSTPSPSPTPVPSPSATPAEAAKPTEETPAAP